MSTDGSESRTPDVSGLLQAGIAAARAGQHGWARDLLARAVELDETCVSAWLWLSNVAESPRERERCLARALNLEPEHDMARGVLDVLRSHHDAPEPIPEPDPNDGARPAASPLSLPPVESASPGQACAVEPDGDHATRSRPAVSRFSAPPLDVDTLLQEGIDAAYAGQAERARNLLSRVVEVDQDHMSAWLWLSYVSDSPAERDRCVARVLGLAGQSVAPVTFPVTGPGSAPPMARPNPPAAATALRPAATAPSPAPVAARHSLAARAMSQPAYAGVPAGRGNYAPPDGPFLRSLAVEASAASILVRGAISEWASTWGLIALAYLAGITLAEVLTTFAHPQVGLVAHSLILLVLLVHSARVAGHEQRAFVLSLAFAPLIRILSLSLPLVDFPILYWYLITSLPLFAGAIVAARSLSYTWQDLGLSLRGWPLQIAIGLTGLIFGCVEYLILRPDSLLPTFDWRSLAVAALILTVSTGLLEELIFRGLLQRAAGDVLGRWGLTYVALLFAVLHVGYKSAADLFFVFAVGLFLGWIVQRTRSLLGVTLAHGMTNVVLFLIMPLLQR